MKNETFRAHIIKQSFQIYRILVAYIIVIIIIIIITINFLNQSLIYRFSVGRTVKLLGYNSKFLTVVIFPIVHLQKKILHTQCREVKRSLYSPGQALRVPRSPDNQHMKVVRLLALGTCRLYPPRFIPGIQSNTRS